MRMLRIVLLFVVAVAIVAVVTRTPGARRTVWVLFGLLVAYAILKATGAIEAIAPSRDGVF